MCGDLRRNDSVEIVADAQELPFRSVSFDWVVATELLEHLPETGKFASEVHRVLEPAGRLFLTVPFMFHLHGDPIDTWRPTPDGLRLMIPKYRKAVLTGDVALRVRELIRQIAAEHELEVWSGKVARDHVHVFLSYRPSQKVSQILQWLKGTSSRVLLQECPRLRKQFWGPYLWARGYLAVSSETITDEMIREYINGQEGEQIAVARCK